jgi:quinoprotein glucose dehydrogenase
MLAATPAWSQSPTAGQNFARTSPVAISDGPVPVKIERAFPNLTFRRPIGGAFPPDGSNRLAVISQYGKVLIFPNDSNVKEAKELLDIHSKVVYKDNENEEGLLGLAFHPKFKENGEFFVYYTTKDAPVISKGGVATPAAAHTSVLARVRMSANDPDRADPGSLEEIFRTPTKPDWNHNGGTIIFGPDGYLYIAIGDGGAANDPRAHGQDLSTVLGKVLRIDVDHKDGRKNYAVSDDNPFVNMEGAAPEVWALGLRNIWRMSFDRQTHKLWAGDVGQDIWEEVDIVERGGNYGWNIREGLHPLVRVAGPPPGPPPEKIIGEFIDPIFEYHHSVGKSIIGGHVYRGKEVPELQGAYLFADYVDGQVYALRYDEQERKVTAVQKIGPRQQPVFSFAEDEGGELYFMTTQGYLFRFRSAAQ